MMRHMWVMRLLNLGIGFLLEKLVLYLAENSNNGIKIKLVSEKLLSLWESMQYRFHKVLHCCQVESFACVWWCDIHITPDAGGRDTQKWRENGATPKSRSSNPPAPSAGRLASPPAWTDHLQRVNRLYPTAPHCVLTDLVFSTTNRTKESVASHHVQRMVYRQVIIPENAPEDLVGSSVASISNETLICNGLSP